MHRLCALCTLEFFPNPETVQRYIKVVLFDRARRADTGNDNLVCITQDLQLSGFFALLLLPAPLPDNQNFYTLLILP